MRAPQTFNPENHRQVLCCAPSDSAADVIAQRVAARAYFHTPSARDGFTMAREGLMHNIPHRDYDWGGGGDGFAGDMDMGGNCPDMSQVQTHRSFLMASYVLNPSGGFSFLV